MKKTRKQDAKFFCESCGSEVPRNARTCPTCGKFFASVRCPKCGNTGTTEEFAKGCPKCGYAVHPQNVNGRGSYNFGNNSKKNKKNNGIFNSQAFLGSNNKTKNSDTPVPFWLYIICIVILVILVMILYSCIFK